MILAINTTAREKIKLGLGNKAIKWIDFKTEDQSKDLLGRIEEILKRNRLDLSDIDAFLVCTSSGSYTGIRVGITTANTLAWSLNKPVFSYNDDNFSEVIGLVKNEQKFKNIALPNYN